MNYLAHLSLAFPDPASIAGNYIADLLTRYEEASLHPLLKQGLKMHRWIDTYSNNDEYLLQINKEFHPVIHKYAPVATDILCDYLLFLSWDKYFDISISEFSELNYKILEEYSGIMPERISTICLKMVQHRWLLQYQSLEGLEEVLKRTNQKTSFDVDLTTVLPVFKSKPELFIELFNSFYSKCKFEIADWLILQNEVKT